MGRVDMMREKRQATSVDLIKLIKKIDDLEKATICIFEGEDYKYYSSRINFVFGANSWKSLSCKGRSKVLDLRDKVLANGEISRAKILFFVDKDYGGRIDGEDLYCTPCYSIENLYVGEKILRRFVVGELGVCEFRHKDEIDALVNEYLDYEAKFDEALLELNSWIMVCVDEDVGVLNLNNYTSHNFASFRDGELIKRYDVTYLSELFGLDLSGYVEQQNAALKTLVDAGVEMSTRGKFRLDFFRVFLSGVVSAIRDGTSSLSAISSKPKITLSAQNIVSELSQYAETPECLRLFLHRWAGFELQMVAIEA